MAVYSMTGYASAASEPGAARPAVVVEARSVNGRFLDLALKLPDELRGLEPALRERLTAAFRRGKIELRMATAREAEGAWPTPGTEQLNRLAHLESSVQGWLPQARALSVNEVLHWCRAGGAAERLDEPALGGRRAVHRRSARGACARRRTPGGSAAGARGAAARAGRGRGALVPAVVQRQQARFLERWHEALAAAQAGASIPAEAAARTRPRRGGDLCAAHRRRRGIGAPGSHLSEIQRLLEAGGEVGKRLDFLIQELQREANTLGSKSAALELTSIAVE